MKAVFLLLALSYLTFSNGLKVLGVFPMPQPSHYILARALMRELADKGHDVTVISPYGEKDLPKNYKYRDIVLTEALEAMEKGKQDINMFDRENSNPLISGAIMTYFISTIVEKGFNNTNVQKLIRSGETFDVVIVEQFINDAQKAFAPLFKAPLISFSSIGANNWVNPTVGNPSPISYISDFALGYSSDMNFFQRLHNAGKFLINQAVHHFLNKPKQNAIIQKYFSNPPELDDVFYNVSLVLLNSHWSTNQAVPYVPNMINIGGFHVSPPKSLPKDLQEFLDNAKEGVVYLSMGSTLKSAQLPVEKRDAIIKSFAKLKQQILWKWEDETLPGKPSNVKLGKWFPQQDILAHPNVKLFITHGGLLSSTEAIYHGVPVLTIPIFGDQKLNAKVSVNNGIGLALPYSELTENALSSKLNELLTNLKYTNNAKKRSEIFHDRLVKPMDEAIYWVEYVARHGGAPHLRVAGLDLPWYKYHLLDVIAFIAAIGLIVLAVNIWIVKKLIFRFCCKNKTASKTQSKSSKKHKQQ